MPTTCRWCSLTDSQTHRLTVGILLECKDRPLIVERCRLPQVLHVEWPDSKAHGEERRPAQFGIPGGKICKLHDGMARCCLLSPHNPSEVCGVRGLVGA